MKLSWYSTITMSEVSKQQQQQQSPVCDNCNQKIRAYHCGRKLPCCGAVICLDCQLSVTGKKRSAGMCPCCQSRDTLSGDKLMLKQRARRENTFVVSGSDTPSHKEPLPPILPTASPAADDVELGDWKNISQKPRTCPICEQMVGQQMCKLCGEIYCRKCLQRHRIQEKKNELAEELRRLDETKEDFKDIMQQIITRITEFVQHVGNQAMKKFSQKENEIRKQLRQLDDSQDKVDSGKCKIKFVKSGSQILKRKNICAKEKELLNSLDNYVDGLKLPSMEVPSDEESTDEEVDSWSEITILPVQRSYSCCWCDEDGRLCSVLNEDPGSRTDNSLHLFYWQRLMNQTDQTEWEQQKLTVELPFSMPPKSTVELCPAGGNRLKYALLWQQSDNPRTVHLHLICVDRVHVLKTRQLPEDSGLPHFDVFEQVVWTPRRHRRALQRLKYPELTIKGGLILLSDTIAKPGAVHASMDYLALRDDVSPYQVHLLSRDDFHVLHTVQADAVFGHGLTLDGELLVADPRRGLLLWPNCNSGEAPIRVQVQLPGATELRVFESGSRVFVQAESERKELCAFFSAELILDWLSRNQKTKLHLKASTDNLLRTLHEQELLFAK